MTVLLDSIQTLITIAAVLVALRAYLDNLIDRQISEARLVYALPVRTTRHKAPVTAIIPGRVHPVEGMSTGPTLAGGQWHITEDVIVYEVTVHNDSKEVMNRLDLWVASGENDLATHPRIPFIEPGGTRNVTVAARMFDDQEPRLVRTLVTFYDSSERQWLREIDGPLYSTRRPWYRSSKGFRQNYGPGHPEGPWWPIHH